jgi:microcystin degradation protein MlrC
MTMSPIRIAVLNFQHETVTFLGNDTTIDDFVYPGSPARGEALLASGPKSYMGGFVQIMEPSTLAELGLDVAAFQVIAIKSRVHFRRGFDDSGFARTILLVEPTEPYLGTVRLNALKYRNVALENYYRFGTVSLRGA